MKWEITGQVGRYTTRSGVVYEGEFEEKDGVCVAQGYGVMISPDKRSYFEGVFSAASQHKKGKMILKDGTVIFEGSMKKGVCYGYCMKVLDDGRIQRGFFVDGKFMQGTITHPSGVVMEGYVKDGVFISKKVIDSNGKVFEGVFNGRDFHGRITYPWGSVYEGALKNGCLCGRGKITEISGTVLEGEFKIDGTFNGKVTKSNGTVLEGKFEFGRTSN